ncbi:MAG: hypothetical protein QOD42_736 [Sphingomonadales bacterium]|jgi:hypothetical protein|nr:hypothetical protein [Sphingomonadales bacterium]
MAAAQASAARAPAFALPAMKATAPPQARADAGLVPPLASLAAIPAQPAVQRKCGPCEAEERDEMPVQPRLEVGPVGDRYEREADTIAGQVMAMRDAEAGPAAPAVQRALGGDAEEESEESEVRPRLEVGPVGDRYEREADTIAGQVMAMREAEISGAAPALQRACAACSASDDEPRARRAGDDDSAAAREEDKEVARARHAQAGGGPETVDASHGDLTGGGAPLPRATQDYFETRMGRDLSGVRIHEGGGSRALNSSIAARAFTYQNHIWLGGGESAGPSFTMAHELAHVMQQTAPGPVGPAARRVMRTTCKASQNLFFYPKTGGDINDFHDDTAKWATTKDRALIGEVRVPNYKKSGYVISPRQFGFADLISANPANLIGMGFTRATPRRDPVAAPPPTGGPTEPSPAAAPQTPALPTQSPAAQGQAPGGLGPISAQQLWYVIDSVEAGRPVEPTNVDTTISDGLSKGVIRAGKKYDPVATDTQLEAKAAPRWGGADFVRDATTAPTNIAVGEIKFGGGRDLADEARTQVGNYATGFKSAQKDYEKVRERNATAWSRPTNAILDKSANDNLAPWSLSTGLLSAWSGPAGWQPISESRRLVIAKWGSDGQSVEACSNCSEEFDGKLFAQHDAKNTFLWLYLFQSLDNAGKFGPTAKAAFKPHKEVAEQLKSDIFASPADKKKMVKRPLPGAPQPALGAAQPDRRRVAAASKKPKPIPSEDFFAKNYPDWKAKQAKLTTDFQGFGKTAPGKSATTAVLFDTAVRNTVDVTGQDPAGKSAVRPGKAQQKQDRETLNDLMLMSGASGKYLGALRKTFGTAFVKVANVYLGLKKKFDDFMKGRSSPGSKHGRLGAAVLKVGGMIFGAIVRHLLPQVAHLLINCVEQGFKAAMEKAFASDIEALVGDRIDELEKKFDEVEANMRSMIDDAIGGLSTWLHGQFESIIQLWDDVAKLIGVARTAFNAARIAMCAAGGLETVGVACVVAGADFVLSLFDVSPGELLAASLLSTCLAQKMIGEHLLTLETIKTLPTLIAEKILAFVKPILPEEPLNLRGMLCDSISGTAEMPEVKEVTCGEGGSDGGTSLGRGYTPPKGVDPAVLNRPPTEDELRKHGRLRHPRKKAPPPPTGGGSTPGGTAGQGGGQDGDGAGKGGQGAAGGAGAGAGRAHGVMDGTVDPVRRKNVTVVFSVYQGFAYGKWDPPKPDTIPIGAIDSDGDIYGPDNVPVLIHEVFLDGTQPKIRLEFADNKLLWTKSAASGPRLGLIKGQIRTMPIRGPQSAGGAKK